MGNEKILTCEELMAQIAEYDKKYEERRAQDEERWAQYASVRAKDMEKLDKLHEAVVGIGESNGRMAEELIYNSLVNKMSFGGRDFDDVIKGYTRARKLATGEKVKGEYDIIMLNGGCIALIEVKYRVTKEDVEKLVNKQVKTFKIVAPEYATYETLLGIGGMTFEYGAQETALKNGVAMLQLSGEAVCVNDDNLKVY